MFIRSSQFLMVTEFISVSAVGGKATLNFATSHGLTTVAFGHPSPHPSSPSQQPRHRGPAERDINQQFELSIVRDEIQIYITMCNPRQEALSKTGAPASTMTSSVSTTVSVVSTYLASSVSGVAGTLLLTSPEWQKDAPHQLHQWKVHPQASLPQRSHLHVQQPLNILLHQ